MLKLLFGFARIYPEILFRKLRIKPHCENCYNFFFLIEFLCFLSPLKRMQRTEFFFRYFLFFFSFSGDFIHSFV